MPLMVVAMVLCGHFRSHFAIFDAAKSGDNIRIPSHFLFASPSCICENGILFTDKTLERLHRDT